MRTSQSLRRSLVQFIVLAILPAVAVAQKGGGDTTGTVNLVDSISTGPDDGRFTIGAGAKRLMYGYPIPYSTSHFVVRVDDHLASNNPRFGSNVAYLSSNRAPNDQHRSISFLFRGVRITQRLLRVNGRFEKVAADAPAQYYQVEYELVNLGDTVRSVGLALLFDTMIDDNDAATMQANGRLLSRETEFRGDSVPREVRIYRTVGRTDDMMGVLVTSGGTAVQPDTLIIGSWPYLHSVAWDAVSRNVPYFDSALLLKWAQSTLAPRAERRIATYYGLPRPGELRALNNEKLEQIETTVHFPLGGTGLTRLARRQLREALRGRTVVGAVVVGHSDATGSDRTNLVISRRRIAAIRAFLVRNGIAADAIVPKAYGESYADQSFESQRRGNPLDRRGEVVLYVQESQ